jgi:dTDP-4-amino-4,6-dideoxygalactose transaminase
MEFRDLNRQYQSLKTEIDNAILNTLNSFRFISGDAVKNLEERLAVYVNRKYCITCANGTDALELILKAWGIKAGDAVFVPDFTFFATAEAVASVGAVPIFVDVKEDTFNIDPEKLSRAVDEIRQSGIFHPRAVISVDLFGQPAEYDALKKVADDNGLILFEDAAQGFGGIYKNKKACSFGAASTTSFFPAKPLGCYGDGGAVFTDDDEKALLIRSLAVHGKGDDKYDNIRVGRNSRLDTIQAAILHVKLDAFEAYELRDVNKAALLYNKYLYMHDAPVKPPCVPEHIYSSWAQYTVKLNAPDIRENIIESLKRQGIPAMVYYKTSMRNQSAFSDITAVQVDPCVTSAELSRSVLSVPIHPYIKESEIALVCKILSEECRV